MWDGCALVDVVNVQASTTSVGGVVVFIPLLDLVREKRSVSVAYMAEPGVEVNLLASYVYPKQVWVRNSRSRLYLTCIVAERNRSFVEGWAR